MLHKTSRHIKGQIEKKGNTLSCSCNLGKTPLNWFNKPLSDPQITTKLNSMYPTNTIFENYISAINL